MNQNLLLELLKLYNEKGVSQFTSLLLKSLTPEATDDKWIALTGWQFYVAGVIYLGARPIDVLDGWNLLQNEKIPVDIYTQAFYITSLYTWLSHNSNRNVEVDSDTYVNNLFVPEVLELLKLCYWVNRCKHTIISETFLYKFNEVKGVLSFRDETELRKQLKAKFMVFGKIGQNESIPNSMREIYAIQFIEELEKFRMNLSSYTAEFMFASFVQQQGLEIEFIPTDRTKKTCDLLVRSHTIEVKTFLDRVDKGLGIESSLEMELEGTLKREKAIQDINDALGKKAEIIFMDLTFTSLGTGFAKYTRENWISFPIKKALEESIILAEQNRQKLILEKVPVLVLTTLIDATICEYRIFAYMIPYPIKAIDNNGYDADYEELSIKSLK